MFAQLPKLFDRNFAIGYFLPVAIFILASYGLLTGYDVWSDFFPAPTDNNAVVYGSIVVVASWLLAVFLSLLNRSIYRLKEGYWIHQSIYIRLNFVQRWRYRRLLSKRKSLEKEISRLEERINRKNAESKPQEGAEELTRLRIKRAGLLQTESEEFPDRDFLLPTSFGNVMRSLESYSRLVYGLEDIQGWSRLLTVIPKDYRELIDSAKARVDFWLNLWALSLLLIIEYVSVVLYVTTYGSQQEGLFKAVWSLLLVYPVGALALAFFTTSRAKGAVISWGDYVKASYDVFLPELGKKLGFPPATREQQKTLWTLFSRVIIYRRPEKIDELLQQLLVDPFEESPDSQRSVMIQDLGKQLIASNSESAERNPQLEPSKQEESPGTDTGARN